MTLSETLFHNIFVYYKPRWKQKANGVALIYITILQVSMILLLGVFFSEFFEQMNMDTISSSKGWVLFALVAIFCYFKNWMYYTGKRRMIIQAKMNKTKSNSTYNIYLLWLLLIAILGLTLVIVQAS
ncbi:MAG: hypothetical protein NWQ07_02645 [Flaviramulus sp.]|nr:hypothetical protein [Flaviramulus sp.]